MFYDLFACKASCMYVCVCVCVCVCMCVLCVCVRAPVCLCIIYELSVTHVWCTLDYNVCALPIKEATVLIT